MKNIGFLSFGHWANLPGYDTKTASDTLLQSIDLAVAAEAIGVDGAYFRGHHFARQLSSPFPLLSAYWKGHREQTFNANKPIHLCASGPAHIVIGFSYLWQPCIWSAEFY